MLTKSTRDAQFAAFMTQASPALLHTAWLLTGNRAAARELVQSALVATYARWPKVDQTQALAYTRRVLVNQRIDGWRRTRRESLTDDIPDQGPAAAYQSASPPDELLVDARDEIVRMLQGLPEQQRKVVVLRYYHDLSERAVAEALGISQGAVKSAASRGLAALRHTRNTTEKEEAR